MNTICYLFIYCFEQFVSFIYFNNKFERKIGTTKICMLYILSFCIQFFLNFTKSPIINLLAFFFCNILVLKLSYIVDTKNTLFSVILLVGLMLTTELLIMFSFSAISNLDLLDYEDTTYSMLFQTITTKALYFSAVYILSKFNSKKARIKNSGDFSLSFLPIVSVSSAIIFNYILTKVNLDHTIYVAFAIISFILLFANVFVFLIHERIISALTQNAEYQLEIQKAEINREYYTELEHQYELSSILIHDIKKHLEIIKDYARDKNFDKIENYIDSVYKGNEIPIIKKYSNNKLVNVIISRYSNLCNNSNITMSVDVRNVDFSFINESDLTSLLNNLLENAYEASILSKDKIINLTIDKKNEKYVMFYVSNSADTSPIIIGDLFSTTKKDKTCHGFGIKSIKKIAKKYQGNAEFYYDDKNKIFYSSILLKYIKSS